MGKAMGHMLTGTFKTCEDCALGKIKKAAVTKRAVAWSTVKRERLFINIRSTSTASLGGKRHGVLVVEDSTGYAWSFFVKEKS